MNGYLLVDKPIGLTSHDVVAKVRRILRQSSFAKASEGLRPLKRPRVGHTGTLDPLATGLMILVIGSYTKRAGEFSKLNKTYEVELTLGYTSKTGDAEGPITPFDSAQGKPSRQRIGKVLKTFVGEGLQTPHAHSAVKIGGQRAYKLARAGKKSELKPRQVTVYRLQVTEYKYPKLKLIAEVSSGTYIRSLAEDIGQKLGTGAYVSALHRTKVGEFKLKDAVQTESLSVEKIAEKLKIILLPSV